MSDALAVPEQAQVPDLVRADPARTITAEDLAFPRLYIGQSISKHVKRREVDEGDLFVAQDADDPDPQIVAPVGSEEGVLFHVLDLRKGKSRSIDGVLETWRYDDPNVPADAWTTYTYFVALPEVDEDLPFRWLLTKSGRPAAQKINTVLQRLSGTKPPHEVAFRVTTGIKTNKKGQEYYVARVRPVEPTEKSLEVARTMASLVEQSQDKVTDASGDNPAI